MLDECAANPASASACTVAATKFLKVVEKGRGLIGLSLLLAINRAVNESLQEKTDLEQWGEVERWSTPLETFDTGYGDCEDYAIAKYVALKRLGVRDENLGIVLIETNITNENHAILAVGASGTRYLLNNGWGGWWGPAEDVSSKNIRPLLIHDSRGGRRFTTQLASKAK